MTLSTYHEWNSALSERFFGPASAYIPVRLDVDEELLGELAGGPPEPATRSFIEAVKGTLSVPGAQPLARTHHEVARWRLADEPYPPPFIGLLGMLSLAANRMRSADGYRASNYYDRLAELLEPNSESDSLRLANHFRQHANALTEYWQRLNAWLESLAGARGLPTAFPFGAAVHVSRALSQALVRAADRDAMTRAFVSEGLSPGEELSPSEMEAYIASWSAAGKFSSSLARIASAPDALTAIAEEACDLLLGWDGETVGAGREPSLEREAPRPRLVLRRMSRPARAPQWTVTIVIKDPTGRHEGTYDRLFDRHPAGRVSMVPSLSPGWTEVGDFVPVAELRQTYALRATTSDSSLEWSCDRPRLLAWDDDLNGYLEVTHGIADQEHVVLALAEHRAAALEILRRHGHGSQSMDTGDHGNWELSTAFPLVGNRETGPRIRLVGGLRLPGRNTYHVESPPDVEVDGNAGGERLVILSPTGDERPLVNEELGTGATRVSGADLHEAKDGLLWVRVIGRGAAAGTESRLAIQAQSRIRLASASRRTDLEEPTMGYDLRRELQSGSIEPMPEDPAGIPFIRGGEIRTQVEDDAPPSQRCWPGMEREWVLPLAHYEAVRATKQCPDCGSDVRILRTAERREPPSTTIRGKCRLVQAGPDGLIWSSLGRAGEHDLGPIPHSTSTPTNLDVLLDAMSLIGRGSMLQARRLVNSMSPDAEAWIADNAIRLFESLGHLEIERDPQTSQPVAWFITPPALTPLAERGQWALSGFRSQAWLEQLREGAEMLGCAAVVERSGTMSIVRVTADSGVRIEVLHHRFSDSAGIPLRLCREEFPRALVMKLPTHFDSVTRLPRAPQPAVSAPAYEATRGRWDTDGRTRSALRRVSEFPRRYVIEHAGSHRYVDVRAGKYLAAAKASVSYLRYDEERKILIVPERAELPSLFERVAVMCSGEMPRRSDGSVRYVAVPGDVALRLAEKLGMKLERPE